MTATDTIQDPRFDVPDEAVVCSHCDRPFASTRQRDLHRGEVHGEALDDEARAAYEAAMEAERDDLWLYHFKAVVVLLAIYMATGLAYLVVLSA